ncbi:UNVERIFIED_CONTAM: protein SENSITIVITY TO RED LIGHT REDUCED 1 [Sesamum radiatum]|uniref:Protein SENSITIVITY TO RED LIGHT REDUCED 1 n=1 Tax=Sesamum radiatum TaxID=300843 RepID=A0AAW2VJK4_SESRA
MSSAAKIICPENSAAADNWTVVLPRRGKRNRSFVIPEKQKESKPWAPIDVETDTERESKLMQKMQNYIRKLENTEFCLSFFDQMQSPEMMTQSCTLMKRKFDWIGAIEIFDPIISLTESKVLTSLGCSVLSINEQGRRLALKPTMFFMPHCEAELYDNLLEANWRVDRLKCLLLFGNSFSAYEQHVSICRSLDVAKTRKHVLSVRRFTEEFRVNTFSDDSFRAFHGSSWHFFNPVTEAELHLTNDS